MITNEQALIIARWWADQLRNPWQGSGDQQDQDWQKVKEVGKLVDIEVPDVPIADERRIELFEYTLLNELPAYLESLEDHRKYIGVDYQPDSLLERCCMISGVYTQALPVKSGTQIHEGKILVNRGYNGEWTALEYPTYDHSLRIEDFSQFTLESK